MGIILGEAGFMAAVFWLPPFLFKKSPSINTHNITKIAYNNIGKRV